jgi:DNA-binding XRE family transcriptional regulator
MSVAYQSPSTVVGCSTLAEGDAPSRLSSFPVHRSVNTFRIYHGEGRRARHLVHELDACRIGHDEWEQMDRMRRKRLVRAGWKLGTGDQFLGLSHLESGLVTTKLALGDAVRSLRQRRGLSQEALAERMGSSQSRVAKLEDGAPGASLDLYLRALFSVHPPAQGDLAKLARRWARGTACAARRATRRTGTGSRRKARPRSG